MSGGTFDYKQYQISNIIDTIERYIERNGRKRQDEELWQSADWYEKYPEDLYYYAYPDEVIEQFKIGVQKLKEAQVYAQRIDWLLACDDGEDSFLERLKEDLSKI
jgi:hypothetical protein